MTSTSNRWTSSKPGTMGLPSAELKILTTNNSHHACTLLLDGKMHLAPIGDNIEVSADLALASHSRPALTVS